MLHGGAAIGGIEAKGLRDRVRGIVRRRRRSTIGAALVCRSWRSWTFRRRRGRVLLGIFAVVVVVILAVARVFLFAGASSSSSLSSSLSSRFFLALEARREPQRAATRTSVHGRGRRRRHVGGLLLRVISAQCFAMRTATRLDGSST